MDLVAMLLRALQGCLRCLVLLVLFVGTLGEGLPRRRCVRVVFHSTEEKMKEKD